MLIKESLWIKKVLNNLDFPTGKKILNVGSQNTYYLEYQEYIWENVLSVCENNGYQLINLDIMEGEGIDISGDITDKETQKSLKDLQIEAIFLFNILEHVYDIKLFCKSINNILPDGGIIIFSGPYDYPKHLDPIDNLFRPEPNELIYLFPNTEILYSEIIEDYPYKYYIFRNWKVLLTTFLRIISPFYKYEKWKNIVIPKLRYFNRPFKTVGVVLRKSGS
ncbi:MAG: hypothetical protein K9J30_15560 [Bacteroidales bacterium]|nr:hypothetical protein [Bacteroidales bacterium]